MKKYVSRVTRRKVVPKRRMNKRKRFISRPTRGIATNTASVRENYTLSVPDGAVALFSASLAEPQYERSQQVANVFQEYRVKYCKITFRPSADTFPIGSGPIPQLYTMVNKAAALTTSTTLQTMLDMGCKPIRFDDKNIVRAWKPSVLLGSDQFPPASGIEVSQIKITPWLSTNLFAQNPGAAWAPSNVQHYGLAFIVTKPSPTTPTINYNIDVEIVFQFRKPLSVPLASEPITALLIRNGQVTPAPQREQAQTPALT